VADGVLVQRPQAERPGMCTGEHKSAGRVGVDGGVVGNGRRPQQAVRASGGLCVTERVANQRFRELLNRVGTVTSIIFARVESQIDRPRGLG
jgi:hypothetical protein